MEDVTPKLLKNIQDDFQERFDNSSVIKKLYEKIKDGTATYNEANEFAVTVGNLLSASFQGNLSDDVLPDGKMYYNIANRILGTTLGNNHKLITDVTSQVQTALNKAAGIGIKAIVPDLNVDRIEGLVNKISSADDFSKVSWLLDEPVINFSQSVVDDSIKVNADFQYKSGMTPKIVRKEVGNCCDWCKEIIGSYKYPDVPEDVYRRHRYCRCMVEFYTKEGNVQDVHTKRTSNSRDLNERIRNSRAYQERQDLIKENALKQRKEVDSMARKEYNKSPAKKLKKIYEEDVADGWISPLSGFTNYFRLYNQIEKEIVGRRTVSDIIITGQTRHFLQRVIGTMVDPKIKAIDLKIVRRSGVTIDDIKQALFEGIARPPMENGEGLSQLFMGEKCNVTINPVTGKLIQCNPNRGQKDGKIRFK